MGGRLPPGHTGKPVKGTGAFQRNGVVQFFSDDTSAQSARPVFIHQMTMKDPEAFANVAVPNPDRRSHAWSYCARLHRKS
jgi:hypothetical protein